MNALLGSFFTRVHVVLRAQSAVEVPTKCRSSWNRDQLQVAAATVQQIQTCVKMAEVNDAPYIVVLDEADKLFASPERAEAGFLKSILALIGFDERGRLLPRRPAMVVMATATPVPVLFQLQPDVIVDILQVNPVLLLLHSSDVNCWMDGLSNVSQSFRCPSAKTTTPFRTCCRCAAHKANPSTWRRTSRP